MKSKKQRNRVYHFFSPSSPAELTAISKVKEAIRSNHTRSKTVEFFGVKGVSYRGCDAYYVAYSVYDAKKMATDLAYQREQYAKVRALRLSIREIEGNRHNPKNSKNKLSLKEILGASTLDQGVLRDREKNLVKSLQTVNSRKSRMQYAFFTLPPVQIKTFADNRASVDGFVLQGLDVDGSRDDFKFYMREIWRRSPAGLKATQRVKSAANLAVKNRRTPYGILTLVGGVHTKPAEFVRLHQEKIRTVLTHTKHPMTRERHIGVEIEASIPRTRWDDLKNLLSRRWGHYIALGTDGSVTESDHYKGGEVRLCAPTSKIDQVVKEVCAALQEVKARVDKTCGLHVHLDARELLDVDYKQMFKNLVRQQLPLYLTQPASRRGNTYCKWTGPHMIDDGYDRYHAINPESFQKYSTVEVRLHSGTILADKINHWIRLLEMIAYGPSLKNSYKTVEGLMNGLELNGEMRDYFIARAAKFVTAPDPVTSEEDNDYHDYQDENGDAFIEEEEWPLEDFGDDLDAELEEAN